MCAVIIVRIVESAYGEPEARRWATTSVTLIIERPFIVESWSMAVRMAAQAPVGPPSG